ncbi:MAG: GNAT family N-acetyltransferase [Candidatus Bathyarchaeota archaeon]|nr:MAG: GNAT family N-acetyltransferase [Candidatus Bathyarchaeota archaeon]
MEFDFSDIERWSREVTLKDGARVTLRAERTSDLEPLWEMVSSFSDETLNLLIDHFSYELIERWIESLDYERIIPILAIKPGGRVVANAILHLSQNEATRHRGVFGIFIHDDYQGRGLGTIMTQLIIEIGRLKGLRKISLDVFTGNERAVHVYEKCGFEIEGLMKEEHWHHLTESYLDSYRMAIHL